MTNPEHNRKTGQNDSSEDNSEAVKNTPESQLAAWNCGQLINQIEHQLQVLWLNGTEENSEDDDTIYVLDRILWQELRLATRNLLDDEKLRVQLQEVIQDAATGWAEQFGAEWHHDLLDRLNQEIEAERDGFEGSLRDLIMQKSLSALSHAESCYNTNQSSIKDLLPSEHLEFYELGRFVDGLIHPLPAYQAMSINLELPVSEFRGWDATAEPISSDIPWRLPRLPVNLQAIDDVWATELIQRMSQLGFEEMGNVESLLNEQSNSHVAVVGAIESQLLEWLSSSESHSEVEGSDYVTREAGDLPGQEQYEPQTVWKECRRFDLAFNDAGLVVKRISSNVEHTVKSKLTYNVLKSIASLHGGAHRSREELEDQWHSLGGSEDLSSAVDSRLTEVRKVLKELDLRLKNKEKVGWRIEVPPTDD